jgi:homoserine kinase
VLAAVYFAFCLCKKQKNIDKISETGSAIEGQPDNFIPALYGSFQVCYRNADKFDHFTTQTAPSWFFFFFFVLFLFFRN